MTDAERFLWKALRSKKINGHRFRRQHPIGQYIADFACIEQRIVIELNGGQHQEQNIFDEQRSVCLQAQGWRVLRFWNNEVLNNIDGVLTVIAGIVVYDRIKKSISVHSSDINTATK